MRGVGHWGTRLAGPVCSEALPLSWPTGHIPVGEWRAGRYLLGVVGTPSRLPWAQRSAPAALPACASISHGVGALGLMVAAVWSGQ